MAAPFRDILHASSAGADLILLGMAEPDEVDFVAYYEGIQRLVAGLPSTLLVLAAERDEPGTY